MEKLNFEKFAQSAISRADLKGIKGGMISCHCYYGDFDEDGDCGLKTISDCEDAGTFKYGGGSKSGKCKCW
jgi:hypothetical protein